VLLYAPWHFITLCINYFLKIETKWKEKEQNICDGCHLMIHLAHFHLTFPGPFSQSLSFRVNLAWPRPKHTHTPPPHAMLWPQWSRERSNPASWDPVAWPWDLGRSQVHSKEWQSLATPASLLKFSGEASRAQRQVLGMIVLNSTQFPVAQRYIEQIKFIYKFLKTYASDI
jgi:hypothetical protein